MIALLVSGLWSLVGMQGAQPATAARPQSANYDAIAKGDDSRIQVEAIDAALQGYLAEDTSGRRRAPFLIAAPRGTLAENTFAYGPIATLSRPVPPALVDALLTAGQNEDRRVRREALFALGSIGAAPTPEQAATLAALLKHDDPGTREAAAAVAGRLRIASAGDALIEAINDRDARVKAAAMRALGQIRDERAVQGLNDQLAHYKRGDLALAAFEGLAGIGHASSVPAFESALGDREAGARRLGAEGLGRSGQAGSAAALEAAFAREKDTFAQLAMTFALCRLDQAYQHRLVEALRVPHTAPQAFAYLLELAPASRRTLEPLLRDPDERLRTLAQRALERMKR
ncbi:MAG: HEAT repeat domain-containing protein [Vicinamibacterales bacterium]